MQIRSLTPRDEESDPSNAVISQLLAEALLAFRETVFFVAIGWSQSVRHIPISPLRPASTEDAPNMPATNNARPCHLQ